MGRLASLVLVLLLTSWSVTASARPCATLALRQAVTDGALPLSSLALQQRPVSVGFVDSETLPVRVHWETEAVAARADEVLLLVEDAWTTLVDDMGFPAPLPDEGEGGDERLDVYLGFVAPASALTIAHEDVDPDDGRAASYVFLHVSPTLDASLMPSFVHHEMAHAVQFALDLEESPMFAEASAMAYERLALPDVPHWADNLGDFQSYPQASVFTNGVDWQRVSGVETFFEHGAGLFLLYLEQEHGDLDGTLVRRLWEASVQPAPSDDDGGAADDNEPDWLDALPAVIGVEVADLLLDFASWRVLIGAWAVPDDGLVGSAGLPGSALVSAVHVSPETLDGAPLSLGRIRLPNPLGCTAVEMRALSDDVSLHVEASADEDDGGGERRPLGAAWVIGDPEEDRAARGRLDDVGPSLAFDLDVPARDTLVLLVCDVGPADADEVPRATSITLSLHNEAVPRYDAGPSPTDGGPTADAGVPDDDAGVVCGCQQVPPRAPAKGKAGPFAAIRPYAVGAMTVIGLLVLVGRARSVARRRRLYKQDAARRER